MGLLELKDATRAFKVNVPAPLLKWNLQTKNDELMPLNISCWPAGSNDGMNMTIELEPMSGRAPLEDVILTFTCSRGSQPVVSTATMGTHSISGSTLKWLVPTLTDSGTLEFHSSSDDSSSFMPFTLTAVSPKTLCDLEVAQCYHMDRADELPMHITRKALYNFKIGE